MSQLSAKLSADVSAYKKSIEQAQNVLKGFNKEESITAETLRKTYDVTQQQVDAFKKVTTSMAKATDGTKTMKQASNALKNDIEKLKIQWANLSDTAKKSNFGAAMAQSIRTAEARLKGMQTQMDATSVVTKTASASMGNMLSIVGKFAPMLGTGTVALNTLKDAFMASESNIDEWGRTVEGAKGMYQTFIESLNRGDLTYFFRNMGKVRDAMREIYDLKDKVGSIAQNNSVAVSNQEATVAKLREDLANDPNNARLKEELKKANDTLTALKLEEVVAKENAGRKQLIESLDKDVPVAVRTQVVAGLEKLGEKWMDYARGMVNYYESGSGQFTSKNVQVGTDANGMPIYQIKNVEKRMADLNSTNLNLYKAYKSLIENESSQLRVSGLADLSSAAQQRASISAAGRKIASSTRVTSGNGGSWSLSADDKKAIEQTNNALQSYFDAHKLEIPIGISNEQLKNVKDKAKELYDVKQYDPKKHLDAVKNEVDAVGNLADAWLSVGDAMKSGDPVDLFAGISKGVAESIDSLMNLRNAHLTTMMASQGQAMGESAASASSLPFPYNLAAIASSVATVAGIFASIKSQIKATPFANGGLVSGPTYALIGEGAGTSKNNPEVVAPLNKLRGMIADTNGGGFGKAEFKIEGRTLVAIMEKENRLNSRR